MFRASLDQTLGTFSRPYSAYLYQCAQRQSVEHLVACPEQQPAVGARIFLEDLYGRLLTPTPTPTSEANGASGMKKRAMHIHMVE